MGVCSIQWGKPPRLQMAFLRQTEERDSRFPHVRLLVSIKDKYVGWENLMALKVIRLYVTGCGVKWGNVIFEERD